ncbi:uncharacterized protein LOC111050418 [Nilaparvata lugens]|uniref:uncharacterized protein LOC111050418 n=1 Tax=Nilaparvata lugens TaxID=108931 RepID=UPI00193CF532|nr:uncharacterized protein LOC111050418 [Nilaparvata lugens]
MAHYAFNRQPVNTRPSTPCSFARYNMRPAATKSNQGEDITLEEVRQGDRAMVIPIENQQREADQENAPGAAIVRPLNYAAGHSMQDSPIWMRHLDFAFWLMIVILIIYLICIIVVLVSTYEIQQTIIMLLDHPSLY